MEKGGHGEKEKGGMHGHNPGQEKGARKGRAKRQVSVEAI